MWVSLTQKPAPGVGSHPRHLVTQGAPARPTRKCAQPVSLRAGPQGTPGTLRASFLPASGPLRCLCPAGRPWAVTSRPRASARAGRRGSGQPESRRPPLLSLPDAEPGLPRRRPLRLTGACGLTSGPAGVRPCPRPRPRQCGAECGRSWAAPSGRGGPHSLSQDTRVLGLQTKCHRPGLRGRPAAEFAGSPRCSLDGRSPRAPSSAWRLCPRVVPAPCMSVSSPRTRTPVALGRGPPSRPRLSLITSLKAHLQIQSPSGVLGVRTLT